MLPDWVCYQVPLLMMESRGQLREDLPVSESQAPELLEVGWKPQLDAHILSADIRIRASDTHMTKPTKAISYHSRHACMSYLESG
jgi:hypothetical protein